MTETATRPSISESHPAPCPMCGEPMLKNPTFGEFYHVIYGNGCLLSTVRGGLMDIARWNEFVEGFNND